MELATIFQVRTGGSIQPDFRTPRSELVVSNPKSGLVMTAFHYDNDWEEHDGTHRYIMGELQNGHPCTLYQNVSGKAIQNATEVYNRLRKLNSSFNDYDGLIGALDELLLVKPGEGE